MNIKLLKDASAIDSLIDEAILSAKTMREKVQCAAVNIIYALQSSGDYPTACLRANRLVDGAGNGINQAALVDFIKEFGGLTIDKVEGEQRKQFTNWSGKQHILDRWNEKNGISKKVDAGILKTVWWSFKQQKPFAGFDLDKELLKLVDRAVSLRKSKKGEEAELVDCTVSTATIAKIQALMVATAEAEEAEQQAA